MATTAMDGVRKRVLTFFSQRLPGTPSSRLNANSIRPAEAIDEKPQNVIAMAMPGGEQATELVRARRRGSASRMYATPPPPVLLARTSAGVGHLERQGDEHDVAEDRRHGDRQEDAPGGRGPGLDGLLGHVGRGVVAGVRPLRLEQAQRERAGDPERDDVRPRRAVRVGARRRDWEQEVDRVRRLRAEREQGDGDRDDEADVPPHRDVVHGRHDLRAGDVEADLDEHQQAGQPDGVRQAERSRRSGRSRRAGPRIVAPM